MDHRNSLEDFVLAEIGEQGRATLPRWLKFDEPLESEYVAYMRDDQLSSALICLRICGFVWLVFLGLDLIRVDFMNSYESLDRGAWGQLVLRSVGLIGFVTVPIYLRGPTRNLERVATIFYLLIGICVGYAVMFYRKLGVPQADLSLCIVVFAAFMPFGLRFMHSLVVATVCVLFAVIVGYLVVPASQYAAHTYWSCMILAALVIGAIGGYSRERVHREQFLMRVVLQRFAFSDSLTTLANRRLFLRHMKTAMAHADRTGDRVIYAIIDVDFFKQFNDKYGHAAGDEALKRVGMQLSQIANRPMDIAARIGGEEFALLLFGADRNSAEQLIEDLHVAIDALEIPHKTSQVSKHLTISIGATEVRRGDTVDTVMRRADSLLYESKREGRNRTTFG